MGWNIELPPAEFYTTVALNGASVTPSHVLESLVREVHAQKFVAIDTETDGLNIWKCLPYYWSLSWTGESGYERRITMPAVTMRYFMETFADPDKQWVFANAKFDTHMLANYGIDIKGKLIDTQVMHALLYEESAHGLKEMAKQILGWKWTDFGDTFGKIRKGYCVCTHTEASHRHKVGPTTMMGACKKCDCNFFKQVTPLDQLRKCESNNLDLLVDYASNDAYGTWMIYKKLKRELEEAPTSSLYDDRWPFINTMADYFFKIEVPFTRVLYTCERNGVKVNRQYLTDITPTIQKELNDLQVEITRAAGRRLSPTSNDQLKAYFIDELGLKPLSYTKGGKTGVKKPSVNEKFLEHYADATPVAKFVLEYKKIDKQFGTYIKKMPERLDAKDRVHMRLNQDVARTGRLSSSDPNMQNVTTGEKDKFKLRNAFIASQGYDLIVADYSQLEMRLLACASREPKMCDIFRRNWDIHMGNAALVFDIPYDDLVKAKKIEKDVKAGKLPESEMTEYVWHCLNARGAAKTIGFGLNYGMKEHSLAKRMGCTVDEAIDKIAQYMDTYPAVRQFYAEALEEVRQTGYAFTLLGRRRYLPDIWASNEGDRWRAERQASNMPIQGTAADVCKMAMILCYEDQLDKKYDCNMLLQVHDELMFECPKEAVPLVKPIIKQWMEHPFPTDLDVALDVEIGSGESWGTAK